MSVVVVGDYEEWRARARALLEQGTPPEQIIWQDAHHEQEPLPLSMASAAASGAADGSGDDGVQPRVDGGGAFTVPRRFLNLSAQVACHRNPQRWDVLFRLLWRLQHEGRDLLDLEIDPDVRQAREMEAQVRRDEHKMRAFVRFTPIADGDDLRYIAWYRPDHLIVRMAAPFFADRFSAMRWSILTPELSAHWDRQALTFTPGVPAPMVPPDGNIEELWRTYYAAVFNPARVNLPALLREMPLRRWQGLPEASLIPGLVSSAHERTTGMQSGRVPPSARPFVPETDDLDRLRQAAAECRGCDLYRCATQVVAGEGPGDARLALIGEQPGDREDIEGRPFVGPAGEVLKRAITAAGLGEVPMFITNAVKHFSFEERGKRRIHKTPRASEVRACRPWLEAELHIVRPACVVCLGSTAARALLGPQVRVMESRGRVIAGTAWAESVIVTIHPSAVLRSDDGERYFEMLVNDLELAARTVTGRRHE
jgi:probable DNA metabolism protein